MADPLKFRNAQGELVDLHRVPATRFKNEFAAMFEQAALGKPVAITKHDTPRAVLISYDEFRALMNARSSGLTELDAQFDALLEQMQEPSVRAAMESAFDSRPGQRVKRIAAKSTRKRRRSKSG